MINKYKLLARKTKLQRSRIWDYVNLKITVPGAFIAIKIWVEGKKNSLNTKFEIYIFASCQSKD